MFRKIAAALVAASLLYPVTAFAREKTYKTESNAIKYCKDDPVVWVNQSSNVYHVSDSRFYGNTNNGYFMCREAAERAGNRPAKTK